MSNVLLQRQGALGYVTELLSGDFDAPFGRSSHHQIWSEAMTVTPLLRGMLGVEVEDSGKTVRFSPQLPADWNSIEVRRVSARANLLDFSLTRGGGQMSIKIRSESPTDHAPVNTNVRLAPALPLDARVRSVKADGRALPFHAERVGDVQLVEATVEVRRETVVAIAYDEGSDVYLAREPPAPGARSEDLRVLRSKAEPGQLRLLLEGRGGRTYTFRLKTIYTVNDGDDFKTARTGPHEYSITVTFDSADRGYVRREFVIPLERIYL
jgi:hypothetical protein